MVLTSYHILKATYPMPNMSNSTYPSWTEIPGPEAGLWVADGPEAAVQKVINSNSVGMTTGNMATFLAVPTYHFHTFTKGLWD